jgi:hypothetical protein
MPEQSPSPSKEPALVSSPTTHRGTKRGTTEQSPVPDDMLGDVAMPEITPAVQPEEHSAIAAMDERAEVSPLRTLQVVTKSKLLYHLLDYTPLSPFQAVYDDEIHTRPALYRIMNYRPALELDRAAQCSRYCSTLLQACGDPALSYEALLHVIAESLTGCLHLVISALEPTESPRFHLEEVSTSFQGASCMLMSSCQQ